MEGTKLRFPDPGLADRPLTVGVHGIFRRDGERIEVVEDAHSAVRLCVDRRGVWLAVDGAEHGVHVNGRPIRRMAMLRAGDAVYVDGIELRLVGAQPAQQPAFELENSEQQQQPDPRIVLRGVGGRYHGRSFTLERPRLVGRNPASDIRIDDPAFTDRHARIELIGEQILLRDLGSPDGSVVNGEDVRSAILHAGDQVVFDGQHRFVVEAPRRVLPSLPEVASNANPVGNLVDHGKDKRGSAWRLPWLLLAALLLAVLLTALLLFGPA